MAETKGRGAQPDADEAARAAARSQRPVKLPDPPFVSEGVALEIETNGRAVDPSTGRVLTVADLPAERRAAAMKAQRQA